MTGKKYFELSNFDSKDIEEILDEIKNCYDDSTDNNKHGLKNTKQNSEDRYRKIRSSEFKNQDLEEKIKKIYKSFELKESIKDVLKLNNIEENKVESNQYIINYYDLNKYIPPHKDDHDIVIIILLDCNNHYDDHLKVSKDSNNDNEIIKAFQDYSFDKKNNPQKNCLEQLENKLQDITEIIKLEKLKPVVLYGGNNLHFSIPAKYNRMVLVFNYNIIK